MFTFKRNPRVSARKAAPVCMDHERSWGVKEGKLALSIATVAAACLSVAVVAAPAHAAGVPDTGGVLQVASTATPYSEEEIRSLQERGDFLGASSRIMANQYALGHMY